VRAGRRPETGRATGRRCADLCPSEGVAERRRRPDEGVAERRRRPDGRARRPRPLAGGGLGPAGSQAAHDQRNRDDLSHDDLGPDDFGGPRPWRCRRSSRATRMTFSRRGEEKRSHRRRSHRRLFQRDDPAASPDHTECRRGGRADRSGACTLPSEALRDRQIPSSAAIRKPVGSKGRPITRCSLTGALHNHEHDI
jgi:hypothetical protein